MKITIIRTDKRNRNYLSTKTLEALENYLRKSPHAEWVGQLRQRIPLMASFGMEYEQMYRLPRLYPAAEFAMTENETTAIRQMNGLILLSVRGLKGPEEVAAVKAAAQTLPMTVMAFEGSSGHSVKLLVKATKTDGTLPADEKEAEEFYAKAYQSALPLYNALLPRPVSQQEASLRSSFRMTCDPNPYYNAHATALLIGEETLKQEAKQPLAKASLSPKAQREADMKRFDDYEFLYRQSLSDTLKELGEEEAEKSGNQDMIIAEVARRLSLMQVPQEEAVLHLRNHSWTRLEMARLRGIVAASYAETADHKPVKDPRVSVRETTQEMIRFLETRYVFRYNNIMGYPEYRPNNTWVSQYRPVDVRVANGFAMDARLNGIDVWDKDVTRYLYSDFVPTYDPIEEYLRQCRGKWDGRDRISEVAAQVKCSQKQWPEWFRTWFLGMVNQWSDSTMRRYGNSTVPLLISRQGYNKSTFCRSLLPPELQWGYTDNLQLAEKKSVLQAMSQMLLVNLDEFNSIPARIQDGFLKNVVQLATVKMKRPYGKHVEEFARRASFIATANMSDVLTDASGSRRFIGIELTGSIRLRPINYEQLYAQALKLIDEGEPCWFDSDQTAEIMESNRQFLMHNPAEEYFAEYFAPTTDEQRGQWLSATAIFDRIRQKAGSGIRLTTLSHFGRTLSNMDGLLRRRTKRGTEYLVEWVEK